MIRSVLFVLVLGAVCPAERYRADLTLDVSGQQRIPTEVDIEGTLDIDVFVHTRGAEIYTQLDLTGEDFSFQGSSAQDNYKLNNPDWGFNLWIQDDATGDFYASQSELSTLDYVTDLDMKTIRIYPAVMMQMGEPPVRSGSGMSILSDPFSALMLPTHWSVKTLPFDEVLTLVQIPDGDANGDGVVNFVDFLSLSTNFGKAGFYRDGDFNYDDQIDFDDFQILASNYGTVRESPPASVPEPASAMLLGLAVVGLEAFRRRRSPVS